MYNSFLICSGIYYIYVLCVCVYVIIPQRSGRLKRNCVEFKIIYKGKTFEELFICFPTTA